MVGRVLRADLAYIAEILEDLRHGAQDRRDDLAALVGLEHDGAPEDDIIGKQRHGCFHVSCFDGGAERVHDLTS
jgi:hypothetical protein